MSASDREAPAPAGLEATAAPGPLRLATLRVQIRDMLRESAHQLTLREADLLLARCCGLSEASMLAHPERLIEPAEVRRCLALAERRAAGEPFAYLFGEREFFGRRFEVDPRVLVPRPETEHLVEAALDLSLPASSTVLDIGTGSGCIAVTLQLERPSWTVFASDRWLSALVVAAHNARRHDAPVRFFGGDLLAPVADRRRVDLLVSNPPYVDPDDPSAYSASVREYEPDQALFAGQGGLAVYRRLERQARELDVRTIIVEIGAGQAAAVNQILGVHFRHVETRRDLQGHERTLVLARREPR